MLTGHLHRCVQTASCLLCRCRSQLDPSQPRSDSRPAILAECCATVGAGHSLGTAPCDRGHAQSMGLGDGSWPRGPAFGWQAQSRHRGLLWSLAQLGLGLWLVVLGCSVVSAMFSLSIEFVDTFHSIFKVLRGEINQMLSGITFAWW